LIETAGICLKAHPIILFFSLSARTDNMSIFTRLYAREITKKACQETREIIRKHEENTDFIWDHSAGFIPYCLRLFLWEGF